MTTDYFAQGHAMGSAFANIGKKKKKAEQDRLELDQKKKALAMKEQELSLAADEKAQTEMVNTKARLGFQIINSDDPEEAWQRAKTTHPGLVNDDVDRRQVQEWVLGGVESGTLGKDFLHKQSKSLANRYKMDEMAQAQKNNQNNAYRDNKLDRGMVDYKMKARNQNAEFATNQRIRQQEAAMGNDRERGGMRMDQIQARQKGAPAAGGVMAGVVPQGAPAGGGARAGVVPQGAPAGGGNDPFAAGGDNDNGMAMTARLMDNGGPMNMQGVASVWKESQAIMKKKGINPADPADGGEQVIRSVARVKSTESKAISALGSQGINPDDAVTILRMVAKQNPQDDDTALINKALQYSQGQQGM